MNICKEKLVSKIVLVLEDRESEENWMKKYSTNHGVLQWILGNNDIFMLWVNFLKFCYIYEILGLDSASKCLLSNLSSVSTPWLQILKTIEDNKFQVGEKIALCVLAWVACKNSIRQ